MTNILDKNLLDTAHIESLEAEIKAEIQSAVETAEARFEVQLLEEGQEYPQLLPAGGEFLVRDIYTDFKRHDLGEAFWERNYDGTLVKEMMTEPLWGVGSIVGTTQLAISIAITTSSGTTRPRLFLNNGLDRFTDVASRHKELSLWVTL